MRGRRSLSNSPRAFQEGETASDDDANADLSIAILAKAKDRPVHASPFVNSILLDSDHHNTIVDIHLEENGSASNNQATVSEDLPSRKPKTSKKKKTKKKKKMKDVQNIRNDVSENIRNDVVYPITGESAKVEGDVLFKLIADDGEDNFEMRKLLRGPRYFDLEQKSDICFRCGNPGHVSAKCREEIQKKACYNCGSHEHQVKACPQGSCFICRGSGHFAKMCPKKGNGMRKKIEGLKICIRCGEDSHEMSFCNRDYHPEDLKVIKCYVCKSYGHLCCVDVALTSERNDSCYNCGEQGHTGVGCAKPHDENSSRLGKVCYKCGEEGHFARGCSKRDEDDLWAASRTGAMIHNPMDGEFQGLLSVPAMKENSLRTHMLSSEQHVQRFNDRWIMNQYERDNKFEEYNRRYEERQNQMSPINTSQWNMNGYERGNKYEVHGGSYGKRQKRLPLNNGMFGDSDNHSTFGSSHVRLSSWQRKHRSH